MDFTYEAPKASEFFSALLVLLKAKGETALLPLLSGATCEIDVSSTFSKQRWNAYWTVVRFSIAADRFGLVTPEIEGQLRSYCDQLMPAQAGLDVMKVLFTPQIGTSSTDSF